MPVLRESLDREGALVSILVGLSDSSIRRLRSQFQPIPQPVECRALLDTGAEITCVDSRLVESLNLVDGGFSFANVPSVRESTMLASLYDLSLTILHPSGEALDHLALPNWRVLELPLRSFDYQVLVGRDVLVKCQFVFDGINERFSLKYPHRFSG